MSDFARHLHLHRVRTTIQIITPYLTAGVPLNTTVILEEFRNSPMAAYAAAGLQACTGAGCLPLAIDDANFEKMSDEQRHQIEADVRLCLRLHFGRQLHIWRECSD